MKNNEIKPLRGFAISIDVCNSTSIFNEILEKENSAEYKLYEINNKINKYINYVVTNSNAILVRFTGDGALLFFAETMGSSSALEAVNFSINFICFWKRVCVIYDILKNIHFRLCIDEGNVITNTEGGLWFGLPLNYASKLKHEKSEYDSDRVTISQTVKDRLKDNIYNDFFEYTGQCIIGKKEIKMYNIGFKDLKNKKTKIGEQKTKAILVCVNAVKSDYYRLRAVITSIFSQTIQPCKIVVITSTNNIKILKEKEFKDIQWIDDNEVIKENRSCVRNKLKAVALESDVAELTCFIDGDTIIAPGCFEIAFNLYQSSRNTIFSAPRIDFDYSLSVKDVEVITNYFIANGQTYNIPAYHFMYTDIEKENMRQKIMQRTFLASYLLFIPNKILMNSGEWDENFKGWGEEDIDFTYRLFLNNNHLIVPNLQGFLSMHLTHDIEKQDNYFLNNMGYLLSKYPVLRNSRQSFYELFDI